MVIVTVVVIIIISRMLVITISIVIIVVMWSLAIVSSRLLSLEIQNARETATMHEKNRFV